MKRVIISPSILASDFKNLDKEIKDIVDGGAEFLHFDVMDGQFVNNISFGIPVLKSLKAGNYPLVFDVHLMIIDPIKYIERFLEAGADFVTIHYEAVKPDDIEKIADMVHKSNKKIGLSIKPNTSVDMIKDYLKLIDLVLVMSVEPGFGGQQFLENSVSKIRELKTLKENSKYNFLIEVDGGINKETAKLCIKAGVDVLVAGSYIFKNKNRKEAIDSLR